MFLKQNTFNKLWFYEKFHVNYTVRLQELYWVAMLTDNKCFKSVSFKLIDMPE